MIKLSTVVLILFAAIGPMFCEAHTDEGDACIVNGLPGNCTRIRDCTPVYRDISRGIYPRVVCGYYQYDPVVCCPMTAPPATTTAAPQATNRSKAEIMCNYYLKNAPKFIIGGEKANLVQFLFMAAVGYNTDQGVAWQCGGTLISAKFVLTAAHCTYNRDWGDAAWIQLGALNLYHHNFTIPVTRQVGERIRFPGYKRPSEYHDIALLKMTEPVVFGAYVRPCCLPFADSDIPSNGRAVAVGWGQQEWGGEASDDLLYVNLNLVPHSVCNSSFTSGIKDDRLEWGIVDAWQLCAGGLGKDTCQGDSGGPLAAYLGNMTGYTLIGVTSLGKVCGSITPGVYTRVYNYVPWIQEIVWTDAEVANASLYLE